MQEGKTMHRALPMSRRIRSSAASVLAVMAFASGAAFGVPDGGRLRMPLESLDPFASLVWGAYTLCYSSCAEPYGMDELRTYRGLLGTRGGRYAFWAVWDACVHRLYRRDELRARICLDPFRLPLSVGLEQVLGREAVSGFPARLSAGFSAFVVIRRGGIACSMKREIDGWMGRGEALIACSVSLDRLTLAAAGCLDGGAFDMREVRGELSAGGIISIETGYRLDTGEVRWGVVCTGGRVLASASWAHHPVLGRTVFLGAGCVWPR